MRRAARVGFTLLELLVVLAIIASVAAIAVLAIPTEDTRLAEDADRLAAKLELARNRAVALQAPVRVVVEEDGYRFMGYTQGQWQDLNGSLEGVRFKSERARMELTGTPWLGPEPVGAPVSYLISSGAQAKRVASDGISQFTVQ
jgi:general secretion pathway protein H